jgi:hypothetical protein
MEDKYLTLESTATIDSAENVFDETASMLDKEFCLKLQKGLKKVQKNYIAGFHKLAGIEGELVRILDAEDNRYAKILYGHSLFCDDNYLSIKEIGQSSEERAWWNYVCRKSTEGKPLGEALYEGDTRMFLCFGQDEDQDMLYIHIVEMKGKEFIQQNPLMEIVFNRVRPPYNLDDSVDRDEMRSHWKDVKKEVKRMKVANDITDKG